MSWDKPLFAIPGVVASGDLSGNQFYCVKQGASGMAVCTVDGEEFDGILYNKPSAANDAAEVVSAGVVKVIAGETLAAGDLWGTDSSGKAKKIEATETGADTRDYFAGRVIEGGAANEYIVATIGMTTGQVAA